jgi:PAS domain S-box-containing protein
MATVLVVDDRPGNRELVVTLLVHKGHRALEASDGAEALRLAHAERPHLIISDILMPTMDGFEFVRRLRTAPELERAKVIFYTAHYHEREALALAQACGVTRVLIKPCEPVEILQAIDEALGEGQQIAAAPATPEFDREHLRVITDKLAQKVNELTASNQRLAALTDVNLALASERNPETLLTSVCRDARGLLGARYAVLCAVGKHDGDSAFSTISGIDAEMLQRLPRPRVDDPVLAPILAERRVMRLVNPGGDPRAVGLPAGYPEIQSVLAAPIASLTRAYGWILLAGKLGRDSFDDEDERVLVSLASQVGRIYENGSLYQEMKRNAEQLSASELRFRQLAENIREVFWLTDPAKRQILYVSPAYEEIWGRSCEALYARPSDWLDAIHADDREGVLQAIRKQASGEYNEEYRIVRPDGSIRWIHDRAFPVFSGEREVYRIAGLAEDVTAEKLAGLKLRESERRLADMLSNVNLISIMLDRDANITYCNDYLLGLTGWPRTDVVGHNWFDRFVPKDLVKNVRRAFADLLKDLPIGWHHENEILTRDGERLVIRWNNTVLRSISGEVAGTASLGEDITEQVRLESALRESEAGLRRAQAVARLAHVVTRPDGSFESWSDTLPALVGVDAAAVPGTTRHWLEIVHPEDRRKFRDKAIEAGVRSERTEVEYRVRRDGLERHIFQVMEPIEGSLDSEGKQRWFNTIQDITERKRAEEEVRRLNADLERRVADRTAELEDANKELEAFDYSISHDLRAPINRIAGFSAMLQHKYGEKLDEHGKDLLMRIEQSGRVMDQLVADLFALSTASRGELRRSEVDLGALAEAIIANLRKAEPGRKVSFEAMAGLTARADPGLLRAVLENLLGNAWKFTGRRADARIELGCLQSAAGRTFFVRDNGAGFDSANAAKLFTPFQRLHSPSEFAGTGIGLATVQRIVRRHGGRVWAQATVGEGATFFFTLSE